MRSKHAFSLTYGSLSYSFVVDEDDEVWIMGKKEPKKKKVSEEASDDSTEEPETAPPANRELGPARNLDDAKRIAKDALYQMSLEQKGE